MKTLIKNHANSLIMLIMVLTMALIFSCAEEAEGGRLGNNGNPDGEQYDFCLYGTVCLPGPFKECPSADGILSNICPFQNNNNNNPSSGSVVGTPSSSSRANTPNPPNPGPEIMNCQISNQCYGMDEADCVPYGGMLSSCTRTTLYCGDYCLWNDGAGCIEISTDPLGIYGGSGHSTCAAASATCDSYGKRFNNTTCSGTPINQRSSSSSVATTQRYYCDYGYPETGYENGCYEIEFQSECYSADGGVLVSNCSSGRRTDLKYCNWGPYLGPYDPNYPNTTGGGCNRISSTYTQSDCAADYGSVVTRCPETSL